MKQIKSPTHVVNGGPPGCAAPPGRRSLGLQVRQMCAADLQQAVQALLGALLAGSGPAVFVGVLLQDGDHVVVAKVHRFLHRRVPPSAQRKDPETLESIRDNMCPNTDATCSRFDGSATLYSCVPEICLHSTPLTLF